MRSLSQRTQVDATITWSKPCKLQDVSESKLSEKYKNNFCIFRIIRKAKKGFNDVYIGITKSQSIYKSLSNHKKLFKKVRGELLLSIGVIDLKELKHTRQRYQELRELLLYWVRPELNPEVKKWNLPSTTKSVIKLKNKGYKYLLPSAIRYPVDTRFLTAAEITF